jgi:hypothetical protein
MPDAAAENDPPSTAAEAVATPPPRRRRRRRRPPVPPPEGQPMSAIGSDAAPAEGSSPAAVSSRQRRPRRRLPRAGKAVVAEVGAEGADGAAPPRRPRLRVFQVRRDAAPADGTAAGAGARERRERTRGPRRLAGPSTPVGRDRAGRDRIGRDRASGAPQPGDRGRPDRADRPARGRGPQSPRGGERGRGRGRDTPRPPPQKLYALESVVDRGFEDVEDESGDGGARRVHWTILKRSVADQQSGKAMSARYVLQRDGAETEFPNLGAARAAANKTITHPEKLTMSKAEHVAARKQ